MGVRERLNEKPALAAAGIVILLTVAAYFCWRAIDHPPRAIAGLGKAFFSTDDGKTWFTAPASNIAPFDDNGTTAYRVEVYRCSHGSAFVVNLEAFSAEDKAKIERTIADGQDSSAVRGMEADAPPLVKKPGDREWVKMTEKNEARYRAIARPVCPDGSADGLEKVDPNE